MCIDESDWARGKISSISQWIQRPWIASERNGTKLIRHYYWERTDRGKVSNAAFTVSIVSLGPWAVSIITTLFWLTIRTWLRVFQQRYS